MQRQGPGLLACSLVAAHVPPHHPTRSCVGCSGHWRQVSVQQHASAQLEGLVPSSCSGEVGVSLWSLSWHIAFLQQQMIGLDSSAVIGFQWAGEGGSEKGLRQLASTNVYFFGVKAGEICKGSIVAVLSFFFSVEKSAGFVCSVCHCKS